MLTEIIQIIIVAGSYISILIVVGIGILQKPKLKMSISVHTDTTYGEGKPAQRARYLGVNIENKIPHILFRLWLSRDSALQCECTITFHHLDRQNIFGRVMYARWANDPHLPPPNNLVYRADIHVGGYDYHNVNVAARFDRDEDCYGWCNENYYSNPVWRNPKWKMPRGRYIVKVDIVSSIGKRWKKLFRLINDVPLEDFRLEPALLRDYLKGIR